MRLLLTRMLLALNPTPNTSGRLILTRMLVFQPVTVRSWELHIHFKVHGSGTDLFGDGFAIWYARDRLQLGSNISLPLFTTTSSAGFRRVQASGA